MNLNCVQVLVSILWHIQRPRLPASLHYLHPQSGEHMSSQVLSCTVPQEESGGGRVAHDNGVEPGAGFCGITGGGRCSHSDCSQSIPPGV